MQKCSEKAPDTTCKELKKENLQLKKKLADLKRTQKDLVEKEMLLRTIIESLPFDVFAIDENGRYSLQNNSCEKNWGHLIGKRPGDVQIDEHTRTVWFRNNRKAFNGEAVEGEVLMRLQGEERFYYNVISPMRSDGRTCGIVGVNIDITESKLLKDSLLAREKELESKTHDLEEMNAALRVLLKKRDSDRVELEEKIQFNVNKLIDPFLADLKNTQLSSRQATLLEIIQTNFDEISSPFTRNFSSIKHSLTPQEIKIASLIRRGDTTKKIAELMGLSLRTIEFHRTKIRRKLGLKHKHDSLRGHLQLYSKH